MVSREVATRQGCRATFTKSCMYVQNDIAVWSKVNGRVAHAEVVTTFKWDIPYCTCTVAVIELDLSARPELKMSNSA